MSSLLESLSRSSALPSPYNTSPIKAIQTYLEEHLSKELATMTDLGRARPSKGTWTSPVFFVREKSGECTIHYRQLNAKTAKDAYPLPHLDDLLGAMSGACVFSTLDAANGYWQIPLADEDIDKTGFVTKYGTYEFTVMPFGLTSAPSCFQRTMTSILGPLLATLYMSS